MTDRKLFEKFADPEYRRAYVEDYLKMYIKAQLFSIRQQRGLTLNQLARITGISPEYLTKLEVVDHEIWDVPVLKRIAHVLGVRLHISFETFGTLVKTTRTNLERLSYDQEKHEFTVQPSSGPYGEMRRKLIPWLREKNPGHERLIQWLQGYDLPPVGDEVLPYEWLVKSIRGEGGEDSLAKVLLSRAETLLREFKWEHEKFSIRRIGDFTYNLAMLIKGLS